MMILFLSDNGTAKYFYIFQDPNTSTNHLVFLDDFYKYFDNECKRQNVHVRRSYLLRSFKSVKSVDGKDTVSVREILRYCFNHFDNYSACKEIVHTVEKSVLFNKASTETECSIITRTIQVGRKNTA